MKTIAFIIPYIGKLPESFPFFLRSCAENPTIDFLMYIDDHEPYEFPSNVKVNYVTFVMLQELFQKNFDFDICLPRPYKFCDFKPMYGEIFSEDLEKYDYWGFCDIDLIWGDIRKFVTDSILDAYLRIYARGHCSIFPNTEYVTHMYRNLPSFQYLDWRKVLSSPDSWCYDEWAGHTGGGLSQIMTANGIDIYNQKDMADIDVRYGRFHIHGYSYIPQFFLWKDGKIFACDDKGIAKNEFIYAHFQKRPLHIEGDVNKNLQEFYIVSPYYISSMVDCHRKCRLKNIGFSASYQINRIKRKIMKIN